MNSAFKELAGSLVRHGLTVLSGVLVAKGVLGADDAVNWVTAGAVNAIKD